MKQLFLPLIVALGIGLGGCAITPSKHFVPVPTDEIHQAHKVTETWIDSAASHSEKAKAAIAGAQKIAPEVGDLHKLLDLASGEVDALTKDLISAKASNASAESKLREVDSKNVALVAEANKMAGLYDALKAKFSELKSRYLKLKFAVCGLIAALALAVLWKFKGVLLMIPPPINAYVMLAYVVVPVVAFGIAWGILSHFGM